MKISINGRQLPAVRQILNSKLSIMAVTVVTATTLGACGAPQDSETVSEVSSMLSKTTSKTADKTKYLIPRITPEPDVAHDFIEIVTTNRSIKGAVTKGAPVPLLRKKGENVVEMRVNGQKLSYYAASKRLRTRVGDARELLNQELVAVTVSDGQTGFVKIRDVVRLRDSLGPDRQAFIHPSEDHREAIRLAGRTNLAKLDVAGARADYESTGEVGGISEDKPTFSSERGDIDPQREERPSAEDCNNHEIMGCPDLELIDGALGPSDDTPPVSDAWSKSVNELADRIEKDCIHEGCPSAETSWQELCATMNNENPVYNMFCATAANLNPGGPNDPRTQGDTKEPLSCDDLSTIGLLTACTSHPIECLYALTPGPDIESSLCELLRAALIDSRHVDIDLIANGGCPMGWFKKGTMCHSPDGVSTQPAVEPQ